MEPCAMIEKGKYIGLVLGELEDKDIVSEEKLKRLKPYIIYLLEKQEDFDSRSIKENFTICKITKTKAAFTLLSDDEKTSDVLYKIQKICNRFLTEKLIVHQCMGKGSPEIRHRVLRFEVNDKHLLVKFIELGQANNFDKVINEIASLYPLGETEDDPVKYSVTEKESDIISIWGSITDFFSRHSLFPYNEE